MLSSPKRRLIMKRTLKVIEKEYIKEQSKLLALVCDPTVNMQSVNEQRAIVDKLYKEWSIMKGGR